jgi:hypothetical protein
MGNMLQIQTDADPDPPDPDRHHLDADLTQDPAK